MKIFIQLLAFFLPWRIRRLVLNLLPGYDIHESAYIGLSIILADSFTMGVHSRIGNLNVIKCIDVVTLSDYSTIGRLNWIYGVLTSSKLSFEHCKNRDCSLFMGSHSAITSRHIVDCSGRVSIGAYSIVAGYRSILLSHSVNLQNAHQEAYPITIGSYCFIGTSCVLLGGSRLPSFSFLSAMSLLNKDYEETYSMYGGIPAKLLKPISREYAFFNRKVGKIK